MRTPSKSSHHHSSSTKAVPSLTKTAESRPSFLTAPLAGQDTTDLSTALAAHEQRHAQALAALEQKHGDRLTQLEERLTTAERATTDLGGQIQEMR